MEENMSFIPLPNGEKMEGSKYSNYTKERLVTTCIRLEEESAHNEHYYIRAIGDLGRKTYDLEQALIVINSLEKELAELKAKNSH